MITDLHDRKSFEALKRAFLDKEKEARKSNNLQNLRSNSVIFCPPRHHSFITAENLDRFDHNLKKMAVAFMDLCNSDRCIIVMGAYEPTEGSVDVVKSQESLGIVDPSSQLESFTKFCKRITIAIYYNKMNEEIVGAVKTMGEGDWEESDVTSNLATELLNKMQESSVGSNAKEAISRISSWMGQEDGDAQ